MFQCYAFSSYSACIFSSVFGPSTLHFACFSTISVYTNLILVSVLCLFRTTHLLVSVLFWLHYNTYYINTVSVYIILLLVFMGRDSSVGIATRYGWTVRGSNPGGGARFSASVQTGPGAYTVSCTMGTGSFPGIKRPGGGAEHPPHLRGAFKF